MIWHLLPLPDWQSAGDSPYVPGTEHAGSPGAAPFVHASPNEATTLAVANDRFTASDLPLVALALDESRLSAPVRFARRDPAGRCTPLEPRPATAEALSLVPHPEGGWYRQTWAAGPSYQPDGYPGQRPAATVIYFLLTPGAESAWHTVRSDEVWLWHAGGPLSLRLGGTGAGPVADPATVTLGPDLAAGQAPQHIIPGGHWQSARPVGDQEVLVSCVVAPGFDFADFQTQ